MNLRLLDSIPQPDPLPLPAPPWLLWLLLTVTFVLHLVAMNLLLGGSVLALVARWHRTNPHQVTLGAWLSKALPTVVAATVSLGVAPLLFVQVLYGRLLFTSAILMGWFWLAVVFLVTAAYYGAYAVAFRYHSPLAAAARWLVPTILLVVAFIYVNNMSLMLRPDTFVGRYLADGRGLNLNLNDPTLIPRYLHFVLGAMAVSALAVVLLGLTGTGDRPGFGRWAVRYGGVWFGAVTFLNLIAGFWWLMALPTEVIRSFLLQRPGATVALTLGVLSALASLALVVLAFGAPRPKRFVQGAVGTLGLTLVVMVLTRDHVRQALLDQAGYEPVQWVEPQWTPIVIFTVLLGAAVASVAWMASLFRPSSSPH